jgi:hypothetical protein
MIVYAKHRPQNSDARNTRCPVCISTRNVRYRPNTRDFKCYGCKTVF